MRSAEIRETTTSSSDKLLRISLRSTVNVCFSSLKIRGQDEAAAVYSNQHALNTQDIAISDERLLAGGGNPAEYLLIPYNP